MASNRRSATRRIGSRTGIRLLDNKTIRRNSRGKEVFDDYFTDNDTETDVSDVSDTPHSSNSHQKVANIRLPPGKRIGSRTGIRLLAGKTIRRDSRGKEIFDDYFSDVEADADSLSNSRQSSSFLQKSIAETTPAAIAASRRKSSMKHSNALESQSGIRLLSDGVFHADAIERSSRGSFNEAEANNDEGHLVQDSRKSLPKSKDSNGKNQRITETPVQLRKSPLVKDGSRGLGLSSPHKRRLSLNPSSIPTGAQSSGRDAAALSSPVAGMDNSEDELSIDSDSLPMPLMSNAHILTNSPKATNADLEAEQEEHNSRARIRLFRSPIVTSASQEIIVTPRKRPALYESRLAPSISLSFSDAVEENPIDDEHEIDEADDDNAVDDVDFRLNSSQKKRRAVDFSDSSESDRHTNNSKDQINNAPEAGTSELRIASHDSGKGGQSVPSTSKGVKVSRSGKEHSRSTEAKSMKRKSTEIGGTDTDDGYSSTRKKKSVEGIGTGMKSSLKDSSIRGLKSIENVDLRSTISERVPGRRMTVSFAREVDSDDMRDVDSSRQSERSHASSSMDRASLMFDALAARKSPRDSSTTIANTPKFSVVLSPVHVSLRSPKRPLPKTPYNAAVAQKVHSNSIRATRVSRLRGTEVTENDFSDNDSSPRRHGEVQRRNSVINGDEVEDAALAGPSRSPRKSPNSRQEDDSVHSGLRKNTRPRRILLVVDTSGDESQREDVSRTATAGASSDLRRFPRKRQESNAQQGNSNEIDRSPKTSAVNEVDHESLVTARREQTPFADADNAPRSPARLSVRRVIIEPKKSREQNRSPNASTIDHDKDIDASDGVAASAGPLRPENLSQKTGPVSIPPKKRGRPRKNVMQMTETNDESSVVTNDGGGVSDAGVVLHGVSARAGPLRSAQPDMISDQPKKRGRPRKNVMQMTETNDESSVATSDGAVLHNVSARAGPLRSTQPDMISDQPKKRGRPRRTIKELESVPSQTRDKRDGSVNERTQNAHGHVQNVTSVYSPVRVYRKPSSVDAIRRSTESVLVGMRGSPSSHASVSTYPGFENGHNSRKSRKLSNPPRDPILIMSNSDDESASLHWGRTSQFTISTANVPALSDSPHVSPRASGGSDKREKQKNNKRKKKESSQARRERSDSPPLVKERPKRHCSKPLEFWRNERIIYQRDSQGCRSYAGIDPGLDPLLSEIRVKSQPRRRTSSQRRKDRKSSPDVSDGGRHPVLDVAQLERNHFVREEQRPILVIDPETEEEVLIDCVKMNGSLVNVNLAGKIATPNDGVIICKSVTQKTFASGFLEMLPNTSKGMCHLKKDTIMFLVLQGILEVTIHETVITVSKRDQFFIPKGNKYNLQNTSSGRVILAYWQLIGEVPYLSGFVGFEMQKLDGKLRIVCDVSIILIAIVILAIFRAGYLSSHKQGFYCGDKSISYPETEESLRAHSLFSIIALLPAVLTLAVEFIFPDEAGRPSRVSFYRAARVYVAYFSAFVCSSVFVFCVKYSIGELRPNFLAVCKPDFSKINCSDGYISEYTCTSGASQAVLEDAASSFPSGHASSTSLMAIFLVLYLEKYLSGRPTKLVVLMVQLGLIAFATVTSIKRITEHQHHWWDTVAGALIGVLFGIYGFKNATITETMSPPKPENVTSVTHINENDL